MVSQSKDITILQGKTFSMVVQWQTTPLIYKAISGITRAAPPVLTVASHGAPDGWPAAVIGAGGMTQINAKNWPLRASDFKPITSLGASSLSFNDRSSERYTAYTSGGYLVYYTPVSLSGFTARMQIRESVESTTTLLSLTTENSRIALDNTAKTITLTISATDTAALDFSTGVYDLELVSGGGVVTELLNGNVLLDTEVTR